MSLLALRVDILVLHGVLLVQVGWDLVVTVNSVVETDLLVDLTHPLSIGLGNTDRAEENVHLLEGQVLGLRED